MEDEFEPVQFITSEIEDDYILSFFVAAHHDPGLGRSIILLRDKKWEHMIPEDEQGVKVSDEDFSGMDEPNNDYLMEIRINDAGAEIKTIHRRYSLDLRHVEKSEIAAAKHILKEMNYDRRFKLAIA